MRIGLDGSKALSPTDGIGRYTRELVRALAELDGGPEIELFGLPPEIEPTARAELAKLPPKVRLNHGWLIEAGRIDVFHATAWNVPPGFRGPLVFTCYDLTFLTHPACHTLENKVHCLTGVLRANLLDAAFVAISQATADELRRHLGLGGARVRVIYPAPSPELRPMAAAKALRRLRKRFGVSEAPVLAVGTLEPRKNLERLFEAYAGLDEQLRWEHPLLIAGGGGWKNERIAARAGGIETAHLLGPVGDDDLAVLYSAAAVFAYPSLAEGFGLPVVEAMACGAPVLTADTSSLPEVVGDAARRVDPLDVEAIRGALAELLRSPDQRQRLSALGLERAASFSWADAARASFDLYRSLAPDRET